MQHQTIDTANSTELLEEVGQFFAPVSFDLVDSLVAQYQIVRQRIDELAGTVMGDRYQGAMQYFLDGNQTETSRHAVRDVERMFNIENAVSALNADFWQRALSLTDVMDFMPQKRRDQWHRQLNAWKEPRYERGRNPEDDLADFEESTVRETLMALLTMRQQFLSERVDGIFRSLSHTHVTNRPEGFSKRMILASVIDCYDLINHGQVGQINDLRAIIARFSGRDEPKWNASRSVIEIARRDPGQWKTVDGGAMRIRVYKKGTAHLEIHEDIAYRLNQILAFLHPAAIPAKFRTPPKRKVKTFHMMERPLPFAVTEILAGMRPEPTERCRGTGYFTTTEPGNTTNPNSWAFGYGAHDKTAMAEAKRVLESVGGVRMMKGSYDWYEFDYNPRDVLDEIITSGCIPDQRSHQFYPTPDSVATEAVERAGIGPDDTVLEPSAGVGHIARFLPQERTTCIEIADLHCKALESQGYNVQRADFLQWAESAPTFSRVVMNPPYSQGRAALHVQAAAQLVRPGGRLVAILPASAPNNITLPGWSLSWSEAFTNEFEGTGISVVILTADKPSQ